MPSGWSSVNANRRPSGAQTGTLTDAPSGNSILRGWPPGTTTTDSPVIRLVRWRPPSAGSMRNPARAR
jgi:hypothetical protein